jgi:predicted PhzF superfamily epimerase YddE/YHI9
LTHLFVSSGHATLATAQIIFSHYKPDAKSIFFQSRTRGSLIARKNAQDGSISLDFPVSSLVTLSAGHRRLEKIVEKVKTVVKEEHVKRIDWADEIGGVVVELSEEIDLKALQFDPSLLVSSVFQNLMYRNSADLIICTERCR